MDTSTIMYSCEDIEMLQMHLESKKWVWSTSNNWEKSAHGFIACKQEIRRLFCFQTRLVAKAASYIECFFVASVYSTFWFFDTISKYYCFQINSVLSCTVWKIVPWLMDKLLLNFIAPKAIVQCQHYQ